MVCLPEQYPNGALDCLKQTISKEGFLGLYKGAPQTIRSVTRVRFGGDGGAVCRASRRDESLGGRRRLRVCPIRGARGHEALLDGAWRRVAGWCGRETARATLTLLLDRRGEWLVATRQRCP